MHVSRSSTQETMITIKQQRCGSSRRQRLRTLGASNNMHGSRPVAPAILMVIYVLAVTMMMDVAVAWGTTARTTMRQRTTLSSSTSKTTRLFYFFADQAAETTKDATTTTDAPVSLRQIDSKDASTTSTTPRIQILMSDTGGGHRASANALRDAFAILTSKSSMSKSTKSTGFTTFDAVDVDIVDIYTDYAPIWPYKDYVAVYKTLAANPWMWNAVYQFGSTDFGLWLNERLLELFCTDGFTQCLQRTSSGSEDSSSSSSTTGNADSLKRADLVISVHPLTQALPLQILQTLDRRDDAAQSSIATTKTTMTTPFCTVVTDLGSAHPTWFHPRVDACFVPSDALNRAARQRGLQPSQIKQYGLPIRQGFWATTTETEATSGSSAQSSENRAGLRQALGLTVDQPVVLVVGGGDGMGGLVDISRQLGQALGSSDAETKSQLVVVCGKNQQAKQQLDSESDQWGANVNVMVQGFVNNMDEWMRASDVLVTKAGPGTIAEASICGLPCMMFSFLPGQEEGNIPFVEDAGFGTYSSNPTEIAATVSSWLSSPEKLDTMQKAALAAARPQATMDIARDILSLLDERRKQTR